VSVQFFGVARLAEIANFAADGSVEDLAEMAKYLAAYSKANAATFMAQYPRHTPAVVGVSAHEIEARARLVSPVPWNVLLHVGLLRYNVGAQGEGTHDSELELDEATAAGLATVIDRVCVILGGRGGR
jgi:hypothetical protein